MRKGELPLSSLQWTFNPCGEGFHLQGVIGIVTLDPQMTSGIEIEIETTDSRTGQIDHRIHLPAEVLLGEAELSFGLVGPAEAGECERCALMHAVDSRETGRLVALNSLVDPVQKDPLSLIHISEPTRP